MFQMFKDKAGEWRWRLKAANGKIIATPGEGYKNRQDCEQAVEAVKLAASTAETVEVVE